MYCTDTWLFRINKKLFFYLRIYEYTHRILSLNIKSMLFEKHKFSFAWEMIRVYTIFPNKIPGFYENLIGLIMQISN